MLQGIPTASYGDPLLVHFPTNEHYALWEVIEFGDSYKAPQEETGKGPTSESSAKKKGRIVVITTKDMQKRKNDAKAKTTLLLALPDEHQLRFSKYETAKELWKAILKTFGGNEATKKTKKNQLKQKYGNFKAEVQRLLSKPSTDYRLYGKGEVHTASVPTTSTQVSTASTDVAAIDEDDIEEIDIKWNLALLSMRADRFWKKTGKKITIQGSDVVGFDKSKVECFNCHKMGNFAKECRAPRSQDRGKRESYKQRPKDEELAPKAFIAINGIGWD
uniref:Ribonuclease H-like domain-containing protein n=1 Tax=Tanacetum cinerariifolium TaxID=118510 RepID=A0A6L2M6M3_TANCI|nr:ribonuclease H-like domain-containing protein [Tanacetum cinerariifolium]